jgi:hypothetical protein
MILGVAWPANRDKILSTAVGLVSVPVMDSKTVALDAVKRPAFRTLIVPFLSSLLGDFSPDKRVAFLITFLGSIDSEQMSRVFVWNSSAHSSTIYHRAFS